MRCRGSVARFCFGLGLCVLCLKLLHELLLFFFFVKNIKNKKRIGIFEDHAAKVRKKTVKVKFIKMHFNTCFMQKHNSDVETQMDIQCVFKNGKKE